jgi:hypothetical protein
MVSQSFKSCIIADDVLVPPKPSTQPANPMKIYSWINNREKTTGHCRKRCHYSPSVESVLSFLFIPRGCVLPINSFPLLTTNEKNAAQSI